MSLHDEPPHHPVDLLPPALARWAQSAASVAYVHELGRWSLPTDADVLVTALVHGNEYSGAIVLDELLHLGWQPARGRITLAFCNVAAFERFDTHDPDASRFVDEDFNRVWSPVHLDAAASVEALRARALRPFVDRATHLLDLHSMHEPCGPLLVTGKLPRNIAFAKKLGTAAQIVIDSGHADGVRMRDYGPFGEASASRIALLLEAGQHWEPDSVRVARDLLMRFLIAAGACSKGDAPDGWLQPDEASPAPVEVTHRIVATSNDFRFTEPFNGNERMPQAGTVIAFDAGKPIATPYDDCVLVMPSLRQLRPGVTTVRLGRRVGELPETAQ
jgi:hypothetical protein